MNEKTIEEFLRSNNDAVLSTFRKNGAVQLSIVTVGYYKGGRVSPQHLTGRSFTI